MESVEAFVKNFSEQGVFGLRACVMGENVNRTLDNLFKIWKQLDNISDEQFQNAKKKLEIKIRSNLSDDWIKIEELLKQQSIFGGVLDLLGKLQSLTKKDVQNVVGKLKKSKVAFVGRGSGFRNVMDFGEIKKLMQS